VFGDRERPATLRALQDRALARYLRRQVFAFSEFYRSRLQRLDGQLRTVRSRDDLAGLPMTSLADVTDPRQLVLRPDEASISRHGGSLTLRLQWAKLTGRVGAMARTMIDPEYKPVLWVVESGVPLAYSAADVERLAEIGRRWLEAAGVSETDTIVSVLPAGGDLGFWQLVHGARRAGLSALYLTPEATAGDLARLRPTVLAGRPGDLYTLLANGSDVGAEALRTVLAVGEPLDDAVRQELRALIPPDAAVLSAWSPPGVRALWAECRGVRGLHTWPASEVIELVDGEVVWTALEWAGSVLVRLHTGVEATIDDQPCPSCGRTNPRLRLGGDLPVFAQVLSTNRGVSAWQAELRTVDGVDELLVFLAPAMPGHPGPLLQELTERMTVTQFIVLERAAVERRISEHGGQVIDTRAG
jgi:hypothetical protein